LAAEKKEPGIQPLHEPERIEIENKDFQSLLQRIEALGVAMEKMRIAEYVQLLDRPWRLIYLNLLAGVARGVGVALGFTILGTILVYILRDVVAANLPGIGEFIADMVRTVQQQLH
jgi:hypothetical protein